MQRVAVASLSCGVPLNRPDLICHPIPFCCILVRSGHSGTRFGRSISRWIRRRSERSAGEAGKARA